MLFVDFYPQSLGGCIEGIFQRQFRNSAIVFLVWMFLNERWWGRTHALSTPITEDPRDG